MLLECESARKRRRRLMLSQGFGLQRIDAAMAAVNRSQLSMSPSQLWVDFTARIATVESTSNGVIRMNQSVSQMQREWWQRYQIARALSAAKHSR